MPPQPVEVFFSYAHEDEELRDQLATQLKGLEGDGVISAWHDRRIVAGQKWGGEIDARLNSADIILLLVSPDFLASDYCRTVEVKRALERDAAGEARVIPVILRPCQWMRTSIGRLQALPKDGKPVTRWDDRDEAFLDVAEGIRLAAESLLPCEDTEEETNDEKEGPFESTSIPRPPIIGFVARRDAQGRDIVERLKEELAPGRNQPVTLSGQGGIGKTTLAAEAARVMLPTYEGRITWSSADGRADFALLSLLDDISTQLGRPDLRTLAPDKKEEQVRALVAEAPALVVLDNYETIAAEEKRRIEAWFKTARCSALFTSRPRVAETVFVPVSAMSRAEADEFLERLAGQTQDAQIFTADVRRRVYETAEANPFVMQWVVGQIDDAREPETVFKELAGGEGDAAQRVFDRSFNLAQLGEDGRAALLALSLFVPSATREALAAVAGFGDDWKRLDEAVKNLHALWLIKGIDQYHRLAVEGLTRRLTGARLSKDERADEFRRRFVAYFLRYAEAHWQPTPENFDALEIEKDNLLSAIDVAFERGAWESVIQIMLGLNYDGVNGWLAIRGYWDVILRYGKHALDAAKALKSTWHIGAFAHSIGAVSANRGDFYSAREYYGQAVNIARRLGAEQGLAATLHQLGIIAYLQGELGEARRLYDESLEIARRLDDQRGVAISLHQLAMLAQEQGELDEARRLYGESLEIEKRLGDQSGVASTLGQLGNLAYEKGEITEARRLYDESLEIARRLGDQSGVAGTLHNLAVIAQDQGKMREARRLYDESLEIEKRLGDQRGVAGTLHQLGRLAQEQGELKEARRLYNESLEIKKRLGDQSGVASTLHQLGRLAEDGGDKAEAARLFREALSIFERLGSPYAKIARESLARVEGEAS